MQYNTLEARNQLSKLIDAALAGEEVVIARRGKPVVRIQPVAAAGEVEEIPGTPAWIAQWFEQNPIAPDAEWAMSDEEVDAYIREERGSWD